MIAKSETAALRELLVQCLILQFSILPLQTPDSSRLSLDLLRVLSPLHFSLFELIEHLSIQNLKLLILVKLLFCSIHLLFQPQNLLSELLIRILIGLQLHIQILQLFP